MIAKILIVHLEVIKESMAIAEHLGPNTNLPDELGPLLNSASSKPVVEEFSIQKLRMWMPRTSWSGFLIV